MAIRFGMVGSRMLDENIPVILYSESDFHVHPEQQGSSVGTFGILRWCKVDSQNECCRTWYNTKMDAMWGRMQHQMAAVGQH